MIFSGKVTNRYTRLPMAGVPVSDGQNIVMTDGQGRFSFQGWSRAHVLHVDILTKLHNDWFFYIDGHQGDFDFQIAPVDTPPCFCFLHTSDTEIENQLNNDWIDFAKKTVRENHPAFFVHTGDLCRPDGVGRHYLLMNGETMGCPVRYTIGNHDFMGPRYGEETYERFYGPTWYSFDCGDIHFVALPVGKIGRSDMPSFYTKEEVLTWLKKDLSMLKKGKRVIVLRHDFCRLENNLPSKDFIMRAEDSKLDLESQDLLAWVFGHSHSHVLHEYNGIYSINSGRPHSGGVDSSAGGIRKISLAKHLLSSQMLYMTPARGVCDRCDWCTVVDGQIGFSTPLLVDNDVIVASFDDGYPKKCGIFRIHGETGELVWCFNTEDGIKNNVAFDCGRLYAQDTKGRLYCIDAADGKLLWQVKSEFYYRGDYTSSAVMVLGDIVIAGSSGDVLAYRKDNGALVWKVVPEKICSEAPSRIVYDEKRKQLIVSMQWAFLVAVDVETGAVKWKNDEQPLWFRTGTPLVTEDMIYTCGSRSVAAVDPDSGRVVISKNLGYVMDVCGSPICEGDTLYYPSAEKGVIAVDKSTLEIKQIYPCDITKLYTSPYIYGDLQTVEGTPCIIDDFLIFAASDGTVRFYDKKTANLKKTISLGEPITVAPLIKEEELIVAGFFGSVVKFKV